MASRRKKDVETVSRASRILERWFLCESEPIYCADDAAQLLQMKLAGLDHEAFAVLFLDARHHTLAFDVMFRGTVNHTQVYPREVARAALKHNAVAVIIAHNHPSGDPTPSRHDELLTDRLGEVLALLDIKLLDHLVIAGTKWKSVCKWMVVPASKTPRRRKRRTRVARTGRRAA